MAIALLVRCSVRQTKRYFLLPQGKTPGDQSDTGCLYVGFRTANLSVHYQFNADFLPSLYTYSVMAGFFNSPLGSKAIVVVTPL